MTGGEWALVTLVGAVGLFLALTAFQVPDGFIWISLGVWAIVAGLFGLAIWRGNERP